jgi:hypothetical protein
MDDLRAEGHLIRLANVGGTMFLVSADAHCDGLIFPPFWFGTANPLIRDHVDHASAGQGEIETEGPGLMAGDIGYQRWGNAKPGDPALSRPGRRALRTEEKADSSGNSLSNSTV